jgi:hypothetical protein
VADRTTEFRPSPGGARWRGFLARHPWLGPLARWGPAVASLALGSATLFVFRRGLPHVAWLVGYLLLLWLVLIVVAALRTALERRGQKLALGVADYTVQTLCHGLLLFVLPAYYATATLDSPNVILLLALAVGAVVTAVDPMYRRLVAPYPWVGDALLGLSMFGALNVALPLVRVPPGTALVASAAVAGAALAPAFHRGGASWPRAGARAAGLAVLAAVAVWYGRAAVPPVPLFLAHATMARDVVALEPVDPIRGTIPAATIRKWGGLAAYTAIHAPAGLRQGVEHVWRGRTVVARIPLAPVLGGRSEGFRTFSRRREWPPPLEGRYRVDVLTASGQLVGRLRFRVEGAGGDAAGAPAPGSG